MILDSISFWNRWSDEKHECDYETVFVNVLFISAKWLKKMTFSCQIYYKQHDEWINRCDFILHDLQTELMNWIWIMNWNWWTWFHDKTTATDWCEQFCWSDEQVNWFATK